MPRTRKPLANPQVEHSLLQAVAASEHPAVDAIYPEQLRPTVLLDCSMKYCPQSEDQLARPAEVVHAYRILQTCGNPTGEPLHQTLEQLRPWPRLLTSSFTTHVVDARQGKGYSRRCSVAMPAPAWICPSKGGLSGQPCLCILWS